MRTGIATTSIHFGLAKRMYDKAKCETNPHMQAIFEAVGDQMFEAYLREEMDARRQLKAIDGRGVSSVPVCDGVTLQATGH